MYLYFPNKYSLKTIYPDPSNPDESRKQIWVTEAGLSMGLKPFQLYSAINLHAKNLFKHYKDEGLVLIEDAAITTLSGVWDEAEKEKIIIEKVFLEKEKESLKNYETYIKNCELAHGSRARDLKKRQIDVPEEIPPYTQALMAQKKFITNRLKEIKKKFDSDKFNNSWKPDKPLSSHWGVYQNAPDFVQAKTANPGGTGDALTLGVQAGITQQVNI